MDRTNVLIEGKARLNAENLVLSKKIALEIKELLFSKEVALKFNHLLASYEHMLTKDKLSALKLSDEITIKNLLRDKLHREIQGIRTRKSEFKELEIVDPLVITKIIEDIKHKIG